MLWVGGRGGMEEELVKRAGIPFDAIPAAGVHGVGARQLPGNLWKLGQGYLAARRILRRFQPHALFFTGGYVAVPMAFAARKVPSALYVPDIEPGLALLVLGRFASAIAVTCEESRAHFPRRAQRVVVTGYPTRPELANWPKAAARQALGLTGDLPVVLVFGGSKGARSINRAVAAVLPELLAGCQLVHITGQLDWPEIEEARAALPETLASRYHAFPYLHAEMGAALAAADLAISRAGASTLGELPLFGLPAILVPYPYAWRYQKVNADYLAGRGAAVVLEDGQLSTDLLPRVLSLLNDPGRLDTMHAAMRFLAHPDAAAHIAAMIADLTGAGERRNREDHA